MHPPSVTQVGTLAKVLAECNAEEAANVLALLQEARDFLLNEEWCFGIGEEYFGVFRSSVVAVFLLQADPAPTGYDEWLWVIVGNLPSDYFGIEESPTPVAALKTYVERAKPYIELGYANSSPTDAGPISSPFNPQFAFALEERLSALTNIVIPAFESAAEQ